MGRKKKKEKEQWLLNCRIFSVLLGYVVVGEANWEEVTVEW